MLVLEIHRVKYVCFLLLGEGEVLCVLAFRAPGPQEARDKVEFTSTGVE